MQERKKAEYQKAISIEEYLRKKKLLKERKKGENTVPTLDCPDVQHFWSLNQNPF
ncbi:hypothetical protein [Faecalicatena contorta]|uniref:hypothetical protein n=1 Tax=Faecalicatena contorta TaxID=39482 RepID=UPI001F3450F5|nr:hypothetical protein [Faecalicatena contorta]MCF2555109.1 hypothetical protein [Faecalicatena contorta]